MTVVKPTEPLCNAVNPRKYTFAVKVASLLRNWPSASPSGTVIQWHFPQETSGALSVKLIETNQQSQLECFTSWALNSLFPIKGELLVPHSTLKPCELKQENQLTANGRLNAMGLWRTKTFILFGQNKSAGACRHNMSVQFLTFFLVRPGERIKLWVCSRETFFFWS